MRWARAFVVASLLALAPAVARGASSSSASTEPDPSTARALLTRSAPEGWRAVSGALAFAPSASDDAEAAL